jgi:threonine dehydratase
MSSTSTPATDITLDDIRQAAKRIKPIAKKTPVMTSKYFDRSSGVKAYFKCENFQTGGAFKIRGAANTVFSIAEQDRKRGVVAFSSGNHGQAVAIAAKYCGIPATIVMPTDAPESKVEATRERGASIVRYDRFKDDRVAIGKKIASDTGATLVPPFDHPMVIAGQGTVALELIEEIPHLDALIVCVGGGGLISGSSIVAKSIDPKIRVIGVEPEDGNDTYLSLAAGKRVTIPPPETIADGLRAPSPGELTFPIIQRNVERVVLVSDKEIRKTVRFLLAALKFLAEPSGAVPAAAALFDKLPKDLHNVGIIVSGGNIDFDLLASF